MERIINSTIDTDTYKLTMGQGVHHNYPKVNAGYEFINRGKTEFPDKFDIKLQDQLEMLSGVKTTQEEENFLRNNLNGILTPDFVDWYKDYQFNPDEVTITRENGGLAINIDGPWERTIYWEVPLMAMISELNFKETGQQVQEGWRERAIQKALTLKEAGARFADFGTRRRYSQQIHKAIVEIMRDYAGSSFLGTSNVRLAMETGVPAIGTFAHEWVMGHAGLFGPELANRKALEVWGKEFNGKLATALTDTLTTEVFLKDFDAQQAEVFKAFRQDSGSPEAWTDKIIARLHQLNIDPLTRTALYSDGLAVEDALRILNYTRNKIQTLFGIGTNLTNDVGVKPLNIVIKLLYIENLLKQRVGVCKISDNPGKVSGDSLAIPETFQRLGLEVPEKFKKGTEVR